VAIDDHGLPTVLRRPVVPDRQAILVRFSRGLTIQAELAYGTGASTLELLPEAGVRHDELAVVEHVVAHQIIDERGDAFAEGSGGRGELIDGFLQTVAELHVLAAQLPEQLGLVVARNAERVTGLYHRHHQAEHLGNLRAPIDQVAEEDRLAPFGVLAHDGSAGFLQRIAQLHEQRGQLHVTTVDVADDVERSVLVAEVVPERLAHDRDVVHFFHRAQDMHVPEAFALEPAQ
jgi:hypothetical protein